VGWVAAGLRDDLPAKESPQFGDGDGDQAGIGGRVGTARVAGGGDGEVDAGEQADGAPAVPGSPADHLPGVQASDLIGELVVFLDPPAGLRDRDQPVPRQNSCAVSELVFSAIVRRLSGTR
jgi:hypothetical protein